ncbi:MAG: helix-turn-helix transcriptional regulator [Lachnospiraceae bacterium]|nr:helix-turn-helix transcriptional regulator [Lachnospiraceae bacterium]
MPLRIPKESLITVQKRSLPADFAMPQMEVAETHYSIGMILTGDRRIITPFGQFDAHAGDVTTMPPLVYHRTFSTSETPYTNYLIKISDKLAERFQREISTNIWNSVFEQKLLSFSEEDRLHIERIMQDMHSVYEKKESYSEVILTGLLYHLVVFLHNNTMEKNRQFFKEELSKEILDAMFYMEQHYAEDLRLPLVATKTGFSEGYFSRLFSSQTGLSFTDYLINIRILRAKELLLQTNKSISEIAIETGFSGGDYFSSVFSRKEGMTPSAFRKNK